FYSDHCRSAPVVFSLIFPWLAFGHLLPYLELAERVPSRGHRVSFVSTPRNIARLPPGAECTNDVPSDEFELLWKAFDALGAPFAEFLGAACAEDAGNKRPDWIIADTFHHWAPLVALQHKIPCAVLLPSASMVASSISQSQGQRVCLPCYEQKQNERIFTVNGASGMSVGERCTLAMDRCTIMAMRSCPEWEPEPFRQVVTFMKKPLVPLGLQLPSPDGGRRRAAEMVDDATMQWLDAQPPDSVVYVALGSEVPLRVELVHELALGLELAGTRFLWALRKPCGVDDSDVFPLGFLEQTHGHGHVAMGWVPQTTILAHAAVGAFLTHCGRNSLVEGLLFGKPLIMLPIIGDQGPNARSMEGNMVGLQVRRDENDGSFERHGVAAAVRAVMVEEETRRVFVTNTLKMQEIVADRELHERYIDGFIQQLIFHVADGNSDTAAPDSSS
uniref:Glycosyltransferase n=1 Tax=Oryza glaberrima TaxID=4538 RepID=I1PJC0_ORYGL